MKIPPSFWYFFTRRNILLVLLVTLLIWLYLIPYLLGFYYSQTRTQYMNSSNSYARAYFAGWCFWCMEGIFEAQNGVIEAISWYAEGSKEDATYDSVSSGLTKHREAVEVIYDPSKISYTTLVDLYYTQIDPTQVDGQFADKGFRYTTAIYYQNTIEKDIIASAKMVLESSHKFDKPIVVQSLPFTTFFPAEEYHQDYYKKSSLRYSLYKKWSGRENFIQEYGKTGSTLSGMVTWNNQYIKYESWIIQTITWSRILLFFHADWCSTCKSFDEQSVLPNFHETLLYFRWIMILPMISKNSILYWVNQHLFRSILKGICIKDGSGNLNSKIYSITL